MPAYFDTGFSVRQPMWHGQGAVLDDYPTDWADARIKAGLTWEPQAVALPELVDPFNLPEADAETGEMLARVRIDQSQKRIVRDDTNASLGIVGSDFTLVSHAAMGEIMESILGQSGVKFETAGACKGGAQVWALAYLDEPYTVAGDDTETLPFLALLNSHDGTGACKIVPTQVRVVCWNTYQAASMQGERTGQQFTFRHSKNVMERIEQAKQALAGVRLEAAEWSELAAELFGMPANDVVFRHFLSEFIPEPPADVVSDRVRNNIDKARSIFKSIYLDSPTTESHRGTALGLVDAATEYLDHVRGYRNSDTYLGRTMLRSEPLKAKAMAIARRLCSVSS